VRVIRYGFGFADVVVCAAGVGTGDAETFATCVEAFAMPRKRWIVDGRGSAMGLRNRSGVGEGIVLRVSCACCCWTSKI